MEIMCQQKTAIETLKKTGTWVKIASPMRAIFEAQCEDARLSERTDKEIEMRLANVEKDIATIKNDMVTKNDLSDFRMGLAEDIKKSAKFSMIEDIFKSWKAWVIILIFFGVLLGTKYLDFVIGLAKIGT